MELTQEQIDIEMDKWKRIAADNGQWPIASLTIWYDERYGDVIDSVAIRGAEDSTAEPEVHLIGER